jgi:hypothetical protein
MSAGGPVAVLVGQDAPRHRRVVAGAEAGQQLGVECGLALGFGLGDGGFGVGERTGGGFRPAPLFPERIGVQLADAPQGAQQMNIIPISE